MFALCRLKHQGSAPRYQQPTGTPGDFGPVFHLPVDLSVGDIRSQIAAVVTDSATVTMESL